MDSLFHFGTPDIKPYKKKNLSLVPSEFFKRDSNLTNENIEEGLSSPIFKKSKFSDAPTPKIFNFSLINCNKNEDDEETCANVEDKPISPISNDYYMLTYLMKIVCVFRNGWTYFNGFEEHSQ